MTQENFKNLFSFIFSISIISLTLFVVREFVVAMLWAAIISIATWSLYERWLKCLKQQALLASLSMVCFVTLIISIPCIYLSYILMQDIHHAALYLININKVGVHVPLWFQDLPFFKIQLTELWNDTLARPNGISSMISIDLLSHMRSFSFLAFKSVGGLISHRLFDFGFSMMTLFFFYKDGKKIIEDIHIIGENLLALRWQRYVNHLPSALRATVNGILLVAMGVGLLMGICYTYAEVPAPALMSSITALFACVPFGAPIVFVLIASYLVLFGNFFGAICVIIWGSIVILTADHFIRPALIGSATRLPFLSVLFGILGGIRYFGLLGLFLGPMIMVLFITLWHEWSHHHHNHELQYA